MKKDLMYIGIIVVLVGALVWSIQRTCKPAVVQYETKVIERIDTIVDSVPKLVMAKFVRYEPVPQEVLRIDTINDTIAISVPIEQRVYEDSTYKAYVSGYEPRLDSIKVYQRERIVEHWNVPKKQRLSGGVQVGYGLTPKGLQPYVGLGLQVNF